MAYQNRKPVITSPKIIVDDIELKKKLIEIGQKKDENMKQTISRLIEREFKEIATRKTGG